MGEKKFFIYIAKCSDGTLYTGWTTDVEKRIKAHNDGDGAKYTRSRGPVSLFHVEEFETKNEALSREMAIKRLSRAQKFMLESGRGGKNLTDDKNKFAQIAKEENSVRKKLRFVALLSREIKLRGRSLMPVLVGGGAVEVYTAGNYSTKDIDLVYDDSKILDEILIPLGFKKDGRYWYNSAADIILECPGSELPRRTQLVRLDEDEEALVISLEEIIVDRLCAFKFWKSEKDGEWARTILSGSANIIDVDFLRKTAAEEDVLDSLEQILAKKG